MQSILVTASSFIKDKALCEELERTFHDYEILYRTGFTPDCDMPNTIAWLVGRESIGERELSHLARLRTIAKYGVGLDNVDFSACARRNVRVEWQAGANAQAVAEHTLGLMLSLCRRIGVNAKRFAQGQWTKDGGRDLSAMNVGLIGLGHVGSAVARLLRAFGATVAFCEIVDRGEISKPLDLIEMTYAELLAWADLLSFHVPLTAETKHMFNAQAMSLTQPGVMVVNTSRGQVLNQRALKAMLVSRHIGGAALDVFDEEPVVDHELMAIESLIGTPHTAGNSKEAVTAMGKAAIYGIKKGLQS